MFYIMLKQKQYFQYKLKHQLFDLSTFLREKKYFFEN